MTVRTTRFAAAAIVAPLALAIAACGDSTEVDDRVVATPDETQEVPVDVPEMPVETPTADADPMMDDTMDPPMEGEMTPPVEDPETAPDM